MVEIRCNFSVDFFYFGFCFGCCICLVVYALEEQEEDEAPLFIKFRFTFQHGNGGQKIGSIKHTLSPLFGIRILELVHRFQTINHDHVLLGSLMTDFVNCSHLTVVLLSNTVNRHVFISPYLHCNNSLLTRAVLSRVFRACTRRLELPLLN